MAHGIPNAFPECSFACLNFDDFKDWFNRCPERNTTETFYNHKECMCRAGDDGGNWYLQAYRWTKINDKWDWPDCLMSLCSGDSTRTENLQNETWLVQGTAIFTANTMTMRLTLISRLTILEYIRYCDGMADPTKTTLSGIYPGPTRQAKLAIETDPANPSAIIASQTWSVEPHYPAITDPSTSNADSDSDRENLSAGAKAGIGVGVALIMLLLMAAFFLPHRRRRNRDEAEPEGGLPTQTMRAGATRDEKTTV
jgi:hypothetical protein